MSFLFVFTQTGIPKHFRPKISLFVLFYFLTQISRVPGETVNDKEKKKISNLWKIFLQ